MNKTASILKNVNFYGILISNLVIGNVCFRLYYPPQYDFLMAISLSICTILVYFLLFKKINFVEKRNWKLFLYSLISCVLIVFSGIILWVLIFETPTFDRIPHLIIFGILGVIASWIFSIFIAFVNFFWLMNEKYTHKKMFLI